MLLVFLVTLRQLAGFRRLLIMTALSAMPVLVALLMTSTKHSPSVSDFENTVVNAMLAGGIAPLVVLAIAGSAFGNEIEDRTIANLVLAPIPRWQIVVPKLLATIALAAPFMVGSTLLTTYIAFLGDTRAVATVTGSILVCVALYSSVFVWLGLRTPQAIGIGLLYVVLWEGFLTGYITGIRMLSIRHYAISMIHGLDPRRFPLETDMSLAAVSIVAAVVFTGFLLLTVRQLRRMDIP